MTSNFTYVLDKHNFLEVKSLLEAGTDISELDYPAVIVASLKGDLEAVKEELKLGASINSTASQNKFTPLMIFAGLNHLEAVKFLLSQKDIEINGDGWYTTPLYIASMAGHIDIVRELLDHGARVRDEHDDDDDDDNDDGDDYDNACPSMFSPHIDVIKLLLERGASANQGDDRETPLNVACEIDSIELAELLISHGASSRTGLWSARSAEMVELLAPLVDANEVNGNNETALFTASEWGRTEAVEALLKHGADPNIASRDTSGAYTAYTPLMVALSRGNQCVAELLVNNGASINQCGDSDTSPLQLASLDYDMVELLLTRSRELGEDGLYTYDIMQGFKEACSDSGIAKLYLDLVDDEESRSGMLAVACQQNKFDIVQSLLLAPGDLDVDFQFYEFSNTPLMAACENDNDMLVRLLLQNGANVDETKNFR